MYVAKNVPCHLALSDTVICEEKMLKITERGEIKSAEKTKEFNYIFLCKIEKIYISLMEVCDGKIDCQYGEDEENCQLEKHHIRFYCLDFKLNQSIPIHYVCNFKNDCPDSSDEKYCSIFNFF